MSPKKTIIRVRKSDNFVIVSRFPLEDKRLSWEARGLYSFLLAKPDDWIISLTNLTNSSPSGLDKAKRILKELIYFKYVDKRDIRNENGQFSYPEYTIYELPYDGYFTEVVNPLTVEPNSVQPRQEQPSSSKPSLLKIQTKPNKQITNKTTTTTDSLVWPKKLSEAHQTSIIALIQSLDVESSQTLIDELAGQLDNIKNPVGYFRTLLQSYLSGSFVPAQAIKIQQQREQRERNQRAIEHANKLAEEQLQQQINKHMEKLNDAKTK